MNRIMEGVKEYVEEMDVELVDEDESKRLVIYARNEGGQSCTLVDLVQLLEWVYKNMPELITGLGNQGTNT